MFSEVATVRLTEVNTGVDVIQKRETPLKINNLTVNFLTFLSYNGELCPLAEERHKTFSEETISLLRGIYALLQEKYEEGETPKGKERLEAFIKNGEINIARFFFSRKPNGKAFLTILTKEGKNTVIEVPREQRFRIEASPAFTINDFLQKAGQLSSEVLASDQSFAAKAHYDPHFRPNEPYASPSYLKIGKKPEEPSPEEIQARLAHNAAAASSQAHT